MATFMFGPKAGLADDATFNAALGVNPAGKLTDLDLGKAVKLIGDSRYGVAAVDDDIEGFLLAVEPNTVNNGYGFGTVLCKERVIVSNAGVAALTVGAYVIAAAQPAVGTAISTVSSGPLTGNRPAPVKAGTPVRFFWRVCSLLGGNGGVGTNVLIERV